MEKSSLNIMLHFFLCMSWGWINYIYIKKRWTVPLNQSDVKCTLRQQPQEGAVFFPIFNVYTVVRSYDLYWVPCYNLEPVLIYSMVPLKRLTNCTYNITYVWQFMTSVTEANSFYGIKRSKEERHLYLTAVCMWTSHISLCGLVFNSKWVTFRLIWLLIFVQKTYLNCTQS